MFLFRMLNLRFLVLRSLQTVLCIVGIALGVGVVVAVDLANRLALESFREGVDVVAGKATHQVVAAAGGTLDEMLFPRFLKATGVKAAAPVIEDTIAFRESGGERLEVVGVDVFLDAPFRTVSARVQQQNPGAESTTDPARLLTEPNRIILPEGYAQRHGLRVGQELATTVGATTLSLVLHATYKPEQLQSGADNLAVMDIAAAQEVFGRVGRLDRIDLILEPEVDPVALTVLLPADAQVVRPEVRTQRVEQMIRSFQMNLGALSLMAVFVGLFLIFNTLTFSVIQRRRQIGILRSIGLERGTIARLFLVEAALLGLIGSLLGLVLGRLLTAYTLPAIAGTVNELYATIYVSDAAFDWQAAGKGLVLGVSTSLLAALFPAWEAASVPPNAALMRPRADVEVHRLAPRMAGAGLLVLALTLVLIKLPVGGVLPGYAGAFTILLGFALLSPLVTLLMVRLVASIAGKAGWLIAVLGVRSVTASLSRTGVAIAALMVSLSMLVGVTLMVQSFRQSLIDWIGQTVRADIYIVPAGRATQRTTAFMPQELIRELEAHPAVEEVDVLRQRRVEVQGVPANLNAVRFDLQSPGAQRRFLVGGEQELAERRVSEGDAVLISETLQVRTDLRAGDRIDLTTPQGSRAFEVAAVYRDYSADGGQIMMNRATYQRHWQDDAVNNAALYLRPGADVKQVLNDLRGTFGGRYAVLMRSNADLRTEVLRVFDNTFAITRFMQLLSVLVAFCGILSALLALLLERTRELATIRALGCTFSQLVRMLFYESGMIGLVASVVGAAAGVLLALLLVFVINVRSFGWTITFHFYPTVLLTALITAVVSACLAAVYPAMRLRQLRLASALREE